MLRVYFGPSIVTKLAHVPAKGRVYRVTLDGKVTEEFPPDALVPCPNGIDILPDGIVRLAAYFMGTVLERAGNTWKTIASGHRSADGIVHDSEGRFYVSEVKTGRVTRYEKDGSEPKELGTGLDMQAAADIFLDEKNGFLIVPDTKAGKLFYIGLVVNEPHL